MSRVGKHAVKWSGAVQVTKEGQVVSAQGKLGTLKYSVPKCLNITLEEGSIALTPVNEDQKTRALWGTARKQIANLVQGVESGFSIDVELIGVGYRAQVSGSKLTLQLGFSHDIVIEVPKGITVTCEKNTNLKVLGPDKQQVGQFVSQLKSYRPVEPYKGKGVIIKGEYVLRKEGKKK